MARREASSLRDLMIIRDRNTDAIEAVNQNLGSALGWKYTNGIRTDHPAIIVFVPDKLNEALVPESQRVPRELETALDDGDTIFCKTDVVRGGKAASEKPAPPLDRANQALVEELRKGRTGIVGGVQLGGFEPGVGPYVGTAACAVRDRQGRIGVLTNQHVAGNPGRQIYHPRPGQHFIGFSDRAFEYLFDQTHFGGIVDEDNAFVRVDCAMVRLSEAAASIVRPGLHTLGPLGETLPVDVDSMGVIGTEVVSVGRTRGVQSGLIAAYAYEFADEESFSIYTDLLIISDDPDGAFSDHGDSGKLIVTKEGLRPVALLWGGWQERLRQGFEQENWTYAIEVSKVLGYLDVEFLAA